MVPLPPLEVTTGIFVASANLMRASSASERATPPPAYISGRRDCAMTLAASRRSSGLGTIREMRAGLRNTPPSCSTPASGGISTKIGRGRPVRICLNASNTASGISRGLIASRCHFVTPRTAPGWSSISCTAPRPLPIAPRGIWPAMRSTGVDRE